MVASQSEGFKMAAEALRALSESSVESGLGGALSDSDDSGHLGHVPDVSRAHRVDSAARPLHRGFASQPQLETWAATRRSAHDVGVLRLGYERKLNHVRSKARDIVDDLRARERRARQQLRERTAEVDVLRADSARLVDRVELSEAQARELEVDKRKLETVLADARSEGDRCAEVVGRLRAENDRLVTSLEQARAESQETREAKARDHVDLSARLEASSTRLTEHVMANKELREKLEDGERKWRAEVAKADQASARASEATQRARELEGLLAESERTRKQLLGAQDGDQAALRTLQDQASGYEGKLRDQAASLRSLTSAVGLPAQTAADESAAIIGAVRAQLLGRVLQRSAANGLVAAFQAWARAAPTGPPAGALSAPRGGHLRLLFAHWRLAVQGALLKAQCKALKAEHQNFTSQQSAAWWIVGGL